MASNEIKEIFSFLFFLVFSILLFLVEIWLSGMKGSGNKLPILYIVHGVRCLETKVPSPELVI